MQINCYISLPSLVKVVCFLYTLVFSVAAIPAACNSASKEGHAVHTEMKICVLVSATSHAAYWLLALLLYPNVFAFASSYFLRATVGRRLNDISKELDLVVHTLSTYPELNSSIKMEVGIEDCLHIEFEYNKSKYDFLFSLQSEIEMIKARENINRFHHLLAGIT